MSKMMVPVRMGVELVARIDVKTENRSALIVAAVEAYLGSESPQQMIIEKPKVKVIPKTKPIEREERASPIERKTIQVTPEPQVEVCRHCGGSLAVLNGAKRCVQCWRSAPLNL